MTNLIKLVEYQQWANAKIVAQLKTLQPEVLEKEFGGSFPSLRLTVLHMLQADYRWLHRLKGNPIVTIPTEWQSDSSQNLLTTWLDVQGQLVETVKTLSAEQLIAFTIATGDRFELPLHEVITHVVNHATYHRGQVVNQLRMAGENPVNTDYFLFVVGKKK